MQPSPSVLAMDMPAISEAPRPTPSQELQLTTPAATVPPPAAAPVAAPSVTPPAYRRFDDPAETRRRIFDRVLAEAAQIQPANNNRHTLALSDVRYIGPEQFSLKEQKKALLSKGTLARKLQGTWTLADAEGNPIAKRTAQLAKVPYMTDRGTFIVNGTEYTMSHQMRLRPGIFTRQKQNGELESHVNVKKGYGHRVYLDPESGIFRIQMGQAKIPLRPLLKAMGVSDNQLREAWGSELAASNAAKDDPRAIHKLYEKLFRNQDVPKDAETQRDAVRKAFEEMELDPEVTKRTLGEGFTNVGADTMMAVTKKLLRVARNEDEPDDRDALAYQRLYGPEDLFSERISKAKSVARNLLWRASAKQHLDNLPPNPYGDTLRGALIGSGLGMGLEEINPADIFDQQVRVTRMGEGGIASLDAVPDDSRSVQPSQFGFVDFLRTPESGKVGVDSRLARATVKGDDGNIYTPVLDREGRQVYKTPQDIADSVVAFPNAMKGESRMVPAMLRGKVRMVPRDQVEFVTPDMESTFSPLANLVPFKSMVKGQRAVMASRMITQALPLQHAEAPLVQSGMPGSDNRSFEQEYAKHMGAVRAEQPGRVLDITDDAIQVQYADGSKKEIQRYNNFPYNRKTMLHQTPMVKPGDTFDADQLLLKSNFTDGEGTTALGLNVRVAYVPWGGLNFEDANVISESLAKRMSSEHMYQHGHEWEKTDHRGRDAFVSAFPSKYPKSMLENFDERGVIKPGTKVNFQDPLILIAGERELNRKSLVRGGRPSLSDKSQLWEHHSPGVVTDVEHTDKGTAVVVKSISPMEVGDKLSGRMGDKGVVAKIVPDAEMPVLADGKPAELLLSPLGLTSRTNPAQIVEAALGKIAAATGKPYRIPDFQDEEDLAAFALRELEKAGISDTETITDPRNDSRIPDVFTGNRWVMKLHHTSEGKTSGRGLGAYTAEGVPARGGAGAAKRIGMLETNSLLAHGATEVVRDGSLVRGQGDPNYWSQYMSGFKPPTPKVPYVYSKFVNSLRASGINVVRQGQKMHIMALTDKDLDTLAGTRDIQNAETVDWKTMEPIKGGLFDPELTGGHASTDGGGNRWSAIKLHEPLPNPVMEEPIRRLLGLTQKKFDNIIAGRDRLGDRVGPGAIAHALSRIDLSKELEKTRAEIAGSKKTARDAAIRKLGYLKNAERLGIHPKDWILKRAPVLPPAFRPVSTLGPQKLPLVADPNYLYKELLDANKALQDISDKLPEDAIGDERLALYSAFKAVTGLGDPTHPKNQERKVKGILKHVFGSSPKVGMVQSRLLGSTVDMVGRSVITPDPDLDMDEVGVPEAQAWSIYEPVLVNRLVRKGMSRAEAARAVTERSAAARQTLLDEMDSGVIVINRAPTLHKYGMMAARPKLTKGNVLRISPLVVGGFGADFDGDAMQYHVPAGEEAQREAAEKMLPSRNLFSAATFKVHYTPTQDYISGLYEASARLDKKQKPATFATTADAVRAFKQGRIGVGRRVEIMDR